LEREMASRHGVPSGQVRLSVPLTFGEIVVMPALIEFQRRFPQVRLDVELSDRVVDFFEQPIDLAIRMTSEPPAAAIARKIGDDRRVLCASPAYLRAHPRPRTARDLADHDCILFAGRRAASEWGLLAAPGSSTIEAVQVRGRMRCNNTRSLHLAARAGLGIANLPLYLVRDDLQEGALVTVLDELVPGDRSIYLVYPAARFMPTAVRELVTFLVDAFAAAPQTRAVPQTGSRARR
ncbi:MAG: substrate binding domain-containing protein, partial [Deltaproteobacteria bacterium]|nr:substrate binding domain-containing protein [Deltaproteobacteria bacterium]